MGWVRGAWNCSSLPWRLWEMKHPEFHDCSGYWVAASRAGAV